MIGKTLPEYVFIRICITLLRLVLPASVVYLALSALARRLLLPQWISIIALCETVFYFAVYLPRLNHLQREPIHKPIPLERLERREIIEKCSRQAGDHAYPRGWFFSSNIRRNNVVEWLLWAIFSSPDPLPEWEEEIEEYLDVVENSLGFKLKKGRCNSTVPIRLNFDPVIASHRPLIWYMIVMAVDAFTALRLSHLGFRHYSASIATKVFPPRVFTLGSRSSVSPHLSYWHFRRSATSSKRPLVFIHGIGIGIHPYLPFLREIVSQDVADDIILIELLPVSFHITDPIPPRHVLLESLELVLSSLGIENAALASHSYGTVIAAHIIRWQNSATAEQREAWTALSSIKHHLLIDPIPFMLHLPDIAKNFVYRKPTHANEWQLYYFASRDPDVARALGRNFFWQENILWKEDLFPDHQAEHVPSHRNFGVVVAAEDQIIPSTAVVEYLRDPTGVREEYNYNERLRLILQPGMDHAVTFDTKESREPLIRILQTFCGDNE